MSYRDGMRAVECSGMNKLRYQASTTAMYTALLSVISVVAAQLVLACSADVHEWGRPHEQLNRVPSLR